MVQQLQDHRPVGGAGGVQHDDIGALPDALGVRLDVPQLQVQREAQILADHHAAGDHLDVAALVGEQLGGRTGLMKAQLVHDDYRARRRDRPVDHLADIGYPPTAAVPAGAGGPGAGGQHHGVGRLFQQEPGADRMTGSHVHAQPRRLRREVARDGAELGPAGRPGGDADLAASAPGPLEEGHVVTPARRGDRGLEPAGTPAHHVDPTASGRPRQRPRYWYRYRHGLPAGPRVLDTAQPPVQPYPADALLV